MNSIDSYKKYFSEYVSDAQNPEEVAKQAVYLCSEDANNITGTVWVVKKGKIPFQGFHT